MTVTDSAAGTVRAAASLDGLVDHHATADPDAPALLLPWGPAPLDVVDGRADGVGRLLSFGRHPGTRTVTRAGLARRVATVAAGLGRAGIGAGTRTALLVPPDADFFALAYALLRVRAVPVVVDPGIGLDRVRRCLADAAPEAFVGVPRAHLARRALRWAPTARTAVTTGRLRLPGTMTLAALERAGSARWRRRGPTPATPQRGHPVRSQPESAEPAPDAPAAILFTSGSTGPPKGVEYRPEQLLAQAALVAELYGLGPDDVSLATFPPFALFGPALGMTTVVPRMDPTRPASARPRRLVRAAERSGATVMFGSPALLDTLARGAPAGTHLPLLRRIVSAGAPVSRDVQRRVLALLGPGAQVHTPYGATEALPVTTIGSDELLALPDDGICVGRPVPGVDVALLRRTTEPVAALTDDRRVRSGEIGEVVVRGPVVSAAYADRPDATAAAKLDWDGRVGHRMGDLAWTDGDGRLWFAGRVAHVVPSVDGPLYSVPCEEVFNRHPAVRRTALVAAAGRPVLCVETAPGVEVPGDLDAQLLALGAVDPRTRAIVTLLRHPGLPVDPRHNAKIDREALAGWAERRLAGRGAR